MIILTWLLQCILTPLLSPLCVGIIRKMKARMQNRRGAGVFQPYKDIWKQLHKDEIISHDASWIFRSAPYIVFAVTIVVGAGVPLFASGISSAFTGDLLVIVYMLAIGTFFLALGGMDTGSSFGGFGSSREMTVAALAEGGLIFSILTMAVVSGTSNVSEIAQAGMLGHSRSFVSPALAFCGFFIVLLAETSRFPFDNPATHLELTMIHEAMILEYSGKRLALMEWASANKLLIFIALAANLFFPVGLANTSGAWELATGLLSFCVKIGIFCALIAGIESVMAKYRYFRLPDPLIVSFILNVVAIGLTH